MNSPLVSVCVPTYNGAEYLEEALDSINNQTYKNLEVIVSDDASVDDTLDIVKRFKLNTEIPVYIYNHEPQGIGANWNNCIKNANGTYIKFLFQDDILDQNCISEMISIAELSVKIGLVYCKRKIIYEQENIYVRNWIGNFSTLHLSWSNPNLTKKVINGLEMLKDSKLMNPPLNKIGEPTAVLLNKKVFSEIGYFNEKLKQPLDLEYWYRVMTKFDIGFVDKELVNFRLHKKQATQTNISNNNDEKQLLSFILLKTIYKHTHNSSQKYILSKIKIYDKAHRLIRRIKKRFSSWK